MSYIEFPFNDKTLKIDSYLAKALMSIAYNLRPPKDTDFVIIVSGSRKVRIGKSTMGLIVAAYLAYLFKMMKLNDNAFSIGNMFWEAKDMMDEVLKRQEHRAVYIYDEAREGLQANKKSAIQMELLDFFNEVGQLNNVYILCISDYFILKEEIAVGRAELLINVYKDYVDRECDLFDDGIKVTVTDFKLGNFKLYNDGAKNMMYDIYRNTHNKNYNSVRPTFPPGKFERDLPINEAEYREMKLKALMRFKQKQDEKKVSKVKAVEIKGIRERKAEERVGILVEAMIKKGIPQSEIGALIDMAPSGVSVIKKKRMSIFDNKPGYFTSEPIE
jgi:hypothetical protein